MKSKKKEFLSTRLTEGLDTSVRDDLADDECRGRKSRALQGTYSLHPGRNHHPKAEPCIPNCSMYGNNTKLASIINLCTSNLALSLHLSLHFLLDQQQQPSRT